jgi:hypothetical protein
MNTIGQELNFPGSNGGGKKEKEMVVRSLNKYNHISFYACRLVIITVVVVVAAAVVNKERVIPRTGYSTSAIVASRSATVMARWLSYGRATSSKVVSYGVASAIVPPLIVRACPPKVSRSAATFWEGTRPLIPTIGLVRWLDRPSA